MQNRIIQTGPSPDNPIIHLHPDDNIAMTGRPLAAGERITLQGRMVTVADDIPFCHKIAMQTIAKNDKIIKYGSPIGSAISVIEPGAHVHIHNLRSDYIASHTRNGRQDNSAEPG